MINKKDLKILSHLRKNGRESLTNMSKKTNIPVSTIYDRLKVHETSLISKFTSLINFSELGFQTRAYVIIKTNKESREKLQEHLKKHPNVNSVFKINNDYDFLIEAIFKGIRELQEFMDNIETNYGITDSKILYIVDDIKRENFLTDLTTYELISKTQ